VNGATELVHAAVIGRIRQMLIQVAGKASIGDFEQAQLNEIELHRFALSEIAAGCQRPSLIAAEALKSTEVPFPRWQGP
jgi:hypothetical protein